MTVTVLKDPPREVRCSDCRVTLEYEREDVREGRRVKTEGSRHRVVWDEWIQCPKCAGLITVGAWP